MFTKKSIFSIPNILCYFRILLVPVFLYVYLGAETSEDYLLSASILMISSFSDFLDGFIARHYNMITELGKLIDPIADKLTQLVVACSLMYKYPTYILMVIIIFLKDGMLLFVGYYVYRKKKRHIAQAEMPGKIATAVFFMVSIALVAFDLSGTFASQLLIDLTVALMIVAMLFYGRGLWELYYADEVEVHDG